MTGNDELWGVEKIAEITSFSKAHIYQNIVKQPDFPAPVCLTDSGRNRRWYADEVRRWIRERKESQA